MLGCCHRALGAGRPRAAGVRGSPGESPAALHCPAVPSQRRGITALRLGSISCGIHALPKELAPCSEGREHGQAPLGSPSALQTTGPGWGKHVGLGLAAKMIYFDFFWLCSPSQGVTWLSCVRVYFPSLHSCRKLLVWEYFGLWRRDMVMAQPVLHQQSQRH